MLQVPCPGCGRLLQVAEGDTRLDSRCPACGEVFRPAEHLPGMPPPVLPPRPTESEHVQDLFLPRRAEPEAARARRSWFLLAVLFTVWCAPPTICVVGTLLDAVGGILSGEPGHVIGLVILLTFGMGLLSLWMCSNSDRPPDDDD